MSFPIAEQIVKDAGCNQWFVQFYENDPKFDLRIKIDHMEFFARHGLIIQQVRSMQDAHPILGFYHVRFKQKDDPVLLEYSNKFEDEKGTSLYPQMYQMFEWSYSGWVNEGGPAQLEQHLQAQNQLQPQGLIGPAGPGGI
jgi:hypothetical protein